MSQRNPAIVVLGGFRERLQLYRRLLTRFARPACIMQETIEQGRELARSLGCQIYSSAERAQVRQGIWRACLEAKPILIVGTRQAVFLPNLKTIIVDEPDRYGLRNDQNPRYRAIAVASWRSHAEGLRLVAGSPALNVELAMMVRAGGRLLGHGPSSPVRTVAEHGLAPEPADLVVLPSRSYFGSQPHTTEVPISQLEYLSGHWPHAWLMGFDELIAIPEFNQQELLFMKIQRLRTLADRVSVVSSIPDHPVFKPNFIDLEIEQRKRYGFPPFGRVVKVVEPSGNTTIKQIPTRVSAARVISALNAPKGSKIELDPLSIL